MNMRTQKRGRRKVNNRGKKRRSRLIILMILSVVVALIVIFSFRGVNTLYDRYFGEKYWQRDKEKLSVESPIIDVQLLTENPYSRPGTPTKRIQNIVVHYTANPGSTAQDNRDYFESLKDQETTAVSSNFIVGLDGEIIQCVPTWEMAYASNSANETSVSIEMCHPDMSGRFNEETYESTVYLCAFLCEMFGLSEEDVIRHYDVTGKNCPLFFVEDEEAYEQFHKDIEAAMQ